MRKRQSPGRYRSAQSTRPSARWLAFVSAESGKEQVLVKPFGRPGSSEQVSLEGGTSPVWSHDGRRIYFRSGLVDSAPASWGLSVDVTEVNNRLEFSKPRKLFQGEFAYTSPIRDWDVLGPDSFVMGLRESQQQRQAIFEDLHPDRLVFIQNWAKRLVVGR